MASPTCSCTTYGTGTTRVPMTSSRSDWITTDKSVRQEKVNATTARWGSSNRSFAKTSTSTGSSNFVCPDNYLRSSTTTQVATVQPPAQKRYFNTYGIAQSSGGGNRFDCFG
ncbi:MAG: hypothetical protein FWC50_03400 [Planctomycetaceae bacterium]|nr:hypothetical protein [Planctomycetaceae bacterium]